MNLENHVDYAKEYSWRNDLLTIIEDVNMKVNNSDFGGFIVSKNVVAGKPIRYTFREKSEVPQLNGWTILLFRR